MLLTGLQSFSVLGSAFYQAVFTGRPWNHTQDSLQGVVAHARCIATNNDATLETTFYLSLLEVPTQEHPCRGSDWIGTFRNGNANRN